LFKKKNASNMIHVQNSWLLYTMVIPGCLFFIFFKYIPLLGSVIAFQDYNIYKGILESKWVGIKHFVTIFSYYDIYRVILNTLRIGLLLVVVGFPVPIILSLLINEIPRISIRRTVQSLLYLPHFFSWVLIANLVFNLLSANGPYIALREFLGMKPFFVMNHKKYFDLILVLSNIWKEAGWGTIIYLAAISGISPSILESSVIDGANKFQRILHIIIPYIIPTAVILLLLRVGQFLDIGFEFIYQFITPINQDIGDIIETYNYRAGIIEGKFSLTAALGISKAVVGLLLITSFNKIANKYSESGGLW
jgi:putative aldouronate transport system permease protein